MRSFVLAATAALAFATAANAAPSCKVGVSIPCGNSCIAKGKECHIAAAKTPNCVKGKLCGHSCIPKADICHKP